MKKMLNARRKDVQEIKFLALTAFANDGRFSLLKDSCIRFDLLSRLFVIENKNTHTHCIIWKQNDDPTDDWSQSTLMRIRKAVSLTHQTNKTHENQIQNVIFWKIAEKPQGIHKSKRNNSINKQMYLYIRFKDLYLWEM